MKSPIEIFDDDIADLERQLELRKEARRQYLLIEAKQGTPSRRFHGQKIIDAVCIVLLESSHALSRQSLIEKLMAGGAATETKRKHFNIDDSIMKSLKHQRLREHNGLIGLPEWGDEKFST